MTRYVVREMMFGTRDEFVYAECNFCGCLQLLTPPDDMRRYYPHSYYSLQVDPTILADQLSPNSLRARAIRARDTYAITGRGIAGHLFDHFRPNRYLAPLRPLATSKRLSKNSRILDVGCGSGEQLFRMRRAGFRYLLGIDPYLTKEYDSGDGTRLLARTINDVAGDWDVIMFHHSFEHIPDQEDALQKVAALLSDGGFCLIRTPIASSFAWRHFRENWAQIDAPRHYLIHTEESMKLLASRAGLTVVRVSYDSNEFQFWASERYRRDIPLMEPKSTSGEGSSDPFSSQDLMLFAEQAIRLNADAQGDQGAFLLERS